ncbi:MAG: hypothetical protein DHS20C11_01750 [Lysobacteraceae bacterium]|nr:MAG: hypothetical protein DHS20C11_01750 [Xanthomonadaceae bacterium]
MTASSAPAGELVIVGAGIQLGRHISQRALSEIEHADVVLCLVDTFALSWLKQVRPDLIELNELYGPGKDRRITYAEMEAAMLAPLREGKRVCTVFYGHPGVFADAPHAAMVRARAEGYLARMEPGVSADACLFADLGFDPGLHGVQSFEATQYLIYQRNIDPSALLILWQVALVGDLSCKVMTTTPQRRQLLVDKLLTVYPLQTEVILYEAATVPVQQPRIDRMPIEALPNASYVEHTTLVIPPAVKLVPDRAMRDQLMEMAPIVDSN